MLQKEKSFHYDHSTLENPYSVLNAFASHSHNRYEIIFLEKGSVNYVIEDKKYRLHKHDLVFTRPLKHHYIEIGANAPYSRCVLAFEPSILDDDPNIRIPDSFDVINCPKDSMIYNLFQRMYYYHSVLEESAFFELFPCLLKELLYNMSLINGEDENAAYKTSSFMAKVLEYINENLFTIKNINEVSAHFFVSEQYLFRQFQTQLKTTPKKYLNAKRLLHAQKMIQQGKKPAQVYTECGFESYAGFYKQYVKTFGYPPSKEKP